VRRVARVGVPANVSVAVTATRPNHSSQARDRGRKPAVDMIRVPWRRWSGPSAKLGMDARVRERKSTIQSGVSQSGGAGQAPRSAVGALQRTATAVAQQLAIMQVWRHLKWLRSRSCHGK
jgi:hypothetical protein